MLLIGIAFGDVVYSSDELSLLLMFSYLCSIVYFSVIMRDLEFETESPVPVPVSCVVFSFSFT